MKIDWDLKAVEEFLELEKEAQRKINDSIEKLPENGLDWKKLELVKRNQLDLEIFRLKVDPSENQKINYRVLFDRWNGNYYILKIGSRTNFYNKENLEQAKNRNPG